MRVLVTGGTGFIGGHVAERLAGDGHDVTILSRSRPRTHGAAGSTRVLVGDLADSASLRHACTHQDAVVHAAGLVGAGATWAEFRRVNVSGTRLLVRAAVAAGVSRLVHLSSLAVHRPPGGGKAIREASPIARHPARWNHYARSKLMAERIVHRAAAAGRIVSVVIRPGLVLGPGDRWTTPWLLRSVSRAPHLMVGNGGNVVPCVTVDDLADAIVRALTRTVAAPAVFDVAAERALTQRELFALHARALGRAFLPVGVPCAAMRALAAILDMLDGASARRPSPPRRLAVAIAGVDANVDCSHAANELGWRGRGSCEDAIRRAVEWELAHGAGSPLGRTRGRRTSARGHVEAT